MLFCYDFPHKKTQDFIFRLWVEDYKINYVIAAPWQKLNLSTSAIRIAPENVGLIHPRILCKAFSIPYIISEHNSQTAIRHLKEHPVDLYIISGARILSNPVIKTTKGQIVNIHPGLLPEARGLDTLLWSIYKDLPLGITAHFVGKKIDSGLLIYKEKLCLKKDDIIVDVSLRLLEKQPEILIKTLKILKKKTILDLENLDLQKGQYHTKMSQVLEKEALKRFPDWLKKYSEK